MKLCDHCLGSVVLWMLITRCACINTCIGKSPCTCEMTDGSGIVDLTSIGKTDNTPRFEDVACTADERYYSYSPCGGFTESQCTRAAACMISMDKQEYTLIGMANEVHFQLDEDTGNILVGYFSGSRPIRVTEVEMICDASACSPVFTPLGQQGGGMLFKFQLKSVCACPGLCDKSGPTSGCTSGSSSAGAISGGSIFLILVFAIFCVYVVIGVLYMKIKKKASGSDLIPNKAMWKNLPGTIKTGFKYFISLFSSKRGPALLTQ